MVPGISGAGRQLNDLGDIFGDPMELSWIAPWLVQRTPPMFHLASQRPVRYRYSGMPLARSRGLRRCLMTTPTTKSGLVQQLRYFMRHLGSLPEMHTQMPHEVSQLLCEST